MSLIGIIIHSSALYFMIRDNDDIVAPIILIALSCVELANASFNIMAIWEPFYLNAIYRKTRVCLNYARILHVAIMHLLTTEAAIKVIHAIRYDPIAMHRIWKFALAIFTSFTIACMVWEIFSSILSSITTLYIIIEVLLLCNLVITYSCILGKLRKNRIKPPVSNLGTFEPWNEGSENLANEANQERLPSPRESLQENGACKPADPINQPAYSSSERYASNTESGKLKKARGSANENCHGNEVPIPAAEMFICVQVSLNSDSRSEANEGADILPAANMLADQNLSNGVNKVFDTNKDRKTQEKDNVNVDVNNVTGQAKGMMEEIKRVIISVPFLILITHIPFTTIPNLVIAITYKYGDKRPSIESNSTALLFNAFGLLVNACLNLFRKDSIRRRTLHCC